MTTLSPHTRVLIADDHADAAETLSALLQAISPVPMVVFVAFGRVEVAAEVISRSNYQRGVMVEIGGS